jgi:hypothetical protein
MRLYKSLWISALMFFGASAVSLYDYANSVDGPSPPWDDDSLIGVSARPVSAECRRFKAEVSYKGLGRSAYPQVKFAYMHDSMEYRSARYSRTHKYHSLTPNECDSVIQDFIKSQSMTVWMDPKNPSYAVFKKDLPLPLIEMFFLLTGLALATAGYLQFAKSRKQQDQMSPS